MGLNDYDIIFVVFNIIVSIMKKMMYDKKNHV